MADNYLRRIEALEEVLVPTCEKSCVKCYLAELHAKANGESWAGCNGHPMDLYEILRAYWARAIPPK